MAGLGRFAPSPSGRIHLGNILCCLLAWLSARQRGGRVLLRIEDRRTWQCVVSYPAIADKLGISVNTVAKYVGLLEEHGLITTERTDVFTKDGLKRNGCLRYTILPIQNAIDRFHERQLAELEQAAAQQRARRQAEKSGVAFIQANREQSA